MMLSLRVVLKKDDCFLANAWYKIVCVELVQRLPCRSISIVGSCNGETKGINDIREINTSYSCQ